MTWIIPKEKIAFIITSGADTVWVFIQVHFIGLTVRRLTG